MSLPRKGQTVYYSNEEQISADLYKEKNNSNFKATHYGTQYYNGYNKFIINTGTDVCPNLDVVQYISFEPEPRIPIGSTVYVSNDDYETAERYAKNKEVSLRGILLGYLPDGQYIVKEEVSILPHDTFTLWSFAVKE